MFSNVARHAPQSGASPDRNDRQMVAQAALAGVSLQETFSNAFAALEVPVALIQPWTIAAASFVKPPKPRYSAAQTKTQDSKSEPRLMA